LEVGGNRIPVEFSTPVRLLNDEEAIAVSLAQAEAQRSVYFHLGGESRAWRLENGRAISLSDFSPGFSRIELAQREKQAVGGFLQSRGIDLTTDVLATTEPDFAWLLDTYSSGQTYAEKLNHLDPNRLPFAISDSLGGRGYRKGIARVIEPLFQELARDLVGAMIKLATEQGIGHFVLGGRILSANSFVHQEMLPEAEEAARRQIPNIPRFTWEVRAFDAEEMVIQVPPILASLVKRELGLLSQRGGLEELIERAVRDSGGTIRQVRNMGVATFEPSSQIAGPLTNAARMVFEGLAQEAIQERGKFVVALSGGRTPRLLYQLLSSSQAIEWDKVYIFSADERKMTAEGEGIGYQVVKESLLDFLPKSGPQPHVYRVNVNDDPEAAVRVYQEEIKAVLGESMRFDLMIVGAGADRHIMSLRPGSPVFSKPQMQFVEVIPHPEAHQQVGYTLTPSVLERARHVLLLLTGDEKQQVLSELVGGVGEASESPIIFLDRLPTGVVSVFTDQAALSLSMAKSGLEELPSSRVPFGRGQSLVERLAPYGVRVWQGLVQADDPSRVASNEQVVPLVERPEGMEFTLEIPMGSPVIRAIPVNFPEQFALWVQPTLKDAVPAQWGMKVEVLPENLAEARAVLREKVRAGDLVLLDKRNYAPSVHRSWKTVLAEEARQGLWVAESELSTMDRDEFAITLQILRNSGEVLPAVGPEQEIEGTQHRFLYA
jgi:6-phosphogluconolactonase